MVKMNQSHGNIFRAICFVIHLMSMQESSLSWFVPTEATHLDQRSLRRVQRVSALTGYQRQKTEQAQNNGISHDEAHEIQRALREVILPGGAFSVDGGSTLDPKVTLSFSWEPFPKKSIDPSLSFSFPTPKFSFPSELSLNLDEEIINKFKDAVDGDIEPDEPDEDEGGFSFLMAGIFAFLVAIGFFVLCL